MIPLKKGATPQVLIDNAQAWTAELLAAIAAGEELKAARKNRYNDHRVKSALLQETHEKCAYCESNVTHIAYGDIEHIVPKKVRPELTYEWTNLTIACDKCNTNKGSTEELIDPYNDPVDQAYTFAGPMMVPRQDQDLANASMLLLQLNRTPLVGMRTERLLSFATRVREIQSTPNEQVKKLLIKALVNDARDHSKEFSACLAAYVKWLGTMGELPPGTV